LSRPRSLAVRVVVARLAPQFPRAIGYPRDRLGVSRIPWPRGLTQAGVMALRLAMPLRVPLLLWVARANVLSLHHALCSRAAVTAAHRLGAPVLAWTVNDPETVRRLAVIGVDAIVSDDPGMALATLLAAVKRLLAIGLFALGFVVIAVFLYSDRDLAPIFGQPLGLRGDAAPVRRLGLLCLAALAFPGAAFAHATLEHDGVRERNEAIRAVADLHARLIAGDARTAGAERG